MRCEPNNTCRAEISVCDDDDERSRVAVARVKSREGYGMRTEQRKISDRLRRYVKVTPMGMWTAMPPCASIKSAYYDRK